MHERAAVTRALAALVAEADFQVGRVIALVGPGIDLDVVQSTWSSAAAGTVVERAELVCEQIEDVLRCLECEVEYAGAKLTPCPACGGAGLVVRRAPEFVVQGWEVA
jgi:Zn finger protein HypA/HybF involved in hydrogenase expression